MRARHGLFRPSSFVVHATKMTKLMEWLLVATVFFSIWIAAITGNIHLLNIKEWHSMILPLPLILVIMFGLYAVIIVLYRVFTFNNCNEAAKELQQQIKEAKSDLRTKGITFRED